MLRINTIPSLVHSNFECGHLADVEDFFEEMIAQLHHLAGVDGDASQVGWQIVELSWWLGGWLAGRQWLGDGLIGLLAGTC